MPKAQAVFALLPASVRAKLPSVTAYRVTLLNGGIISTLGAIHVILDVFAPASVKVNPVTGGAGPPVTAGNEPPSICWPLIGDMIAF